MIDWLLDVFIEYGDMIIVYGTLTEDTMLTDPRWLAKELEGISTPPTYDELREHRLYNENWDYIFNDWKDKGILN